MERFKDKNFVTFNTRLSKDARKKMKILQFQTDMSLREIVESALAREFKHHGITDDFQVIKVG